MLKKIENLFDGSNGNKRIRILAYGSSNTERYLPGTHWFDCFELAIRQKYGRIHTCINTGLSGDTTKGLLERFGNDAEFYKPQMAFITIGGNDSNPDKNISENEFRSNLKKLHSRFTDMGCKVVFQTYYSPDPDLCDAVRLKIFYQYMETVREVATETESELIDHLCRWERLRIDRNDTYKKLMLNGFHTNQLGNEVLGVDIARCFGIDLSESIYEGWGNALSMQKIMDELEGNS
jgi:lysophospholipase L1-like esterase